MKSNLAVQQEELVHTAQFERPVLSLWAEGKRVVTGLYQAFSPFGVGLGDIRAEGVNPADQVLIVNLGIPGVHRFRFDRTETAFFQFSQEAFQKIPLVLDASLHWLREAAPDLSVKVHQFVHTSHSKLTEGTVEELLKRIGPSAPKSGGTDKGSGVIFHCEVPEERWATQLVIDRSVAVTNGLFVMFTLSVPNDKVNFVELAYKGREYLFAVLSEMGLAFDVS